MSVKKVSFVKLLLRSPHREEFVGDSRLVFPCRKSRPRKLSRGRCLNSLGVGFRTSLGRTPCQRCIARERWCLHRDGGWGGLDPGFGLLYPRPAYVWTHCTSGPRVPSDAGKLRLGTQLRDERHRIEVVRVHPKRDRTRRQRRRGGRADGPEGASHSSGLRRTSILPVLRPVKRPANAAGAFSMPSRIVSRYLIFPSESQPRMSAWN